MIEMLIDAGTFRQTLESRSTIYDVELNDDSLTRLVKYYELLSEWNPRLHLVGPCAADEFATRHVLESLFMLNYIPAKAVIADIGSGAGLPIIPCLIVRPELRAILIEASPKKAVFLREALSCTQTEKAATVLAQRFESISPPPANVITCRALDRFSVKLPQVLFWAPRESTLLLFGGASIREGLTKLDVDFREVQIPDSERRFLFVAKN